MDEVPVKMSPYRVGWLTITIFLFLRPASFGDTRTWTRSDGNTVEAELVGVEESQAKLKLSDGNVFEVPLTILSLDDQKFAADWLKAKKAPATASKSVPPSFPLQDPVGYPPRPDVPCRLVIVKLPGATSELRHDGFEQVATDDYTDIVKIGEEMRGGNVLAIRQDGGLILWRQDGEKVAPRNSDAVVACNSGFRSEIVWVSSDAKLNCESEDDDFEQEVRRIDEVVLLRARTWGVFTISKDGTRHLISARLHRALQGANIDVQDVADISELIGNGFWVLLRDGSLLGFNGEQLNDRTNPETYFRLPHSHVRQRADGRFDGFAMAYAFAAGLKYPPGSSPEIHVGGKAGAHRSDRSQNWTLLLQEDKWQPDPSFMRAFGDAADIRIQESRYLYALFPADTVPRSGLWDLDELIEARRLLAK